MDFPSRNGSLPNLLASNSLELNKISIKSLKKPPSSGRSSSCLKTGNRFPSPLFEKKQTPSTSNHFPINLNADLMASHKYTVRTEASPLKPLLEQTNSYSARKQEDLCASQLREKSKAYYKNLTEKIIDLKNMFSDYYKGDNMPLLPKRIHVNRVVECLELLKKDESEQQELMTIIIKMLKATLYVNHEVATELEKGIRFLGETDLMKVIKSCQQENIPYYTLCFAVFKEVAKQGQKAELTKEDYDLKMDSIKEIIEAKDRKIEELSEQMSRCVTYEVFESVLQEKDAIQKQWEELGIENKNLKNHQKELEKNIVDLKGQIEKGVQDLKDYIEKMADVAEANEIYLKDIEEYKHLLGEAKNKVKAYKNTMDSVIVKVSDMKQQITNLIKINDQISFENEKLKLRAATAFEYLTPRPNYKKLQKEKKIELDIYDEKKNQVISTAEIVEGLLDTLLRSETEGNDGNALPANHHEKRFLLSQGNNSKTRPSSGALPGVGDLADAIKASDYKNAFKKRTLTAWPKIEESEGNETGEKLENTKNDTQTQRMAEESLDLKGLNVEKKVPSHMRKTQSFAFKIKSTGDETNRSFGREVLKGVNEIISKAVNTKKKML